MWCVGELTHEYRQRMYHLLSLYQQPLDAREPVVCIDEKSLQLIAHSRTPLPMSPGHGASARAINQITNQFYEARSDQNGAYLIRNIPAGNYRLMVSVQGFKILLIEDVPVHSATLTEANVVLEVGSVSEAVMVSGDLIQLQTESCHFPEMKPGLSEITRVSLGHE